MSRRGAALASLPSDDPSIPASPAARWQARFGTRPPARSQALIAAALAWAEQVAAAGDVAPRILHDLAIIAHQVRVARLDRQAGGNGATDAAAGKDGAWHATSPDCGAPRTICAKSTSGMLHQMAPVPDDVGAIDVEVLPPSPQPRRRSRQAAVPLPTASSQLSVGARLVKVHKGVTHVVEVTADGLRYQGQLFASLSAVAKHITGTHWNGLLFFGLRRRKTYPAEGRVHG